MTWRVAKSLEVLLAEINEVSPSRSKLSDGSIGDAAHASRDSDHNPWVKDGSTGVVTARDFTNDPPDFDSSDFAEWLRKRCKNGQEDRVKYIISDRRICSGTIENWAWRSYNGLNAHLHHVHVSVLSSKAKYDSKAPWGWVEAHKTKDDDDMKWHDRVKLTAKDAEIWGINPDTGKPYKEGDEVTYSAMVRYPTLARKTEKELQELTKLVKQLIAGKAA